MTLPKKARAIIYSFKGFYRFIETVYIQASATSLSKSKTKIHNNLA